MQQNQLFNRTRWRLASWYTGVMSLILVMSGGVAYQLLTEAHWHALHQELESVSGTLHDGLEPILEQPGQINDRVFQLLPGLCLTSTLCAEPTEERHVLGAVQQEGYYMRFLDQSGQLIATNGHPPKAISDQLQQSLWQTLETPDGKRYHQISILLKNNQHAPWGYLQVGRSLQEFDHYLATLRLTFLLGLPITILFVIAASWWLAGLAMRPVYRSYQQVQQFTADVAHELRTPLAATKATIESVLELETLPEPEARNTLYTIERQNNRLAQLVQDLLLLSRMDLQVLPVKHQPCCLNSLLTDVLDEFSAMAIAADIDLRLDIRVPYPVYVLGNEEQLFQLIANLVTNAIQYTPAGGNITVSLGCDSNHAVIQVRDTGIGIASEDQPRIFDRFYRVSRDRSRQTGGAGLGLAIALAIAKQHNGNILVQSAIGQGSELIVRLPLK
ncbi:two-component system sensor histidine kinase RppB [Leptolyngbya sp. GGD]|uniref:two-component system sensor histidine kinase RppB n=1 Tax=Leptolyngbya sp. GGD TaxID=2997907 RepID=UPI00227B1706|nr:two-component system sensor histidine kinase RppB [Leptolyngbya sp. GGD]MCY6491199.1 ATP-binding protein [Leptolyngbya sp. GGD]